MLAGLLACLSGGLCTCVDIAQCSPAHTRCLPPTPPCPAPGRMQEASYIDMAQCEKEKEAGNEAFKQARYPEAVQHYSEALKRGPSKGEQSSGGGWWLCVGGRGVCGIWQGGVCCCGTAGVC